MTRISKFAKRMFEDQIKNVPNSITRNILQYFNDLLDNQNRKIEDLEGEIEKIKSLESRINVLSKEQEASKEKAQYAEMKANQLKRSSGQLK